MEIEGSGPEYQLARGDTELGTVRYENGAVTGEAECADGSTEEIEGKAADRTITLTVGEAQLTAEKQREAGSRFAAFFIAVAVVMLRRAAVRDAVRAARPAARDGRGARRHRARARPWSGALWPDLEAALFPSDIIPYIGVVAQLGLIFYMFLIGLEVDLSQIKGRVGQVAAISNVSVALPMMLGIAIALPVYELVGPDKKFVAFALFMGVSMSITAFPVLARILVERRMLKRPVGVLALACAAVDDVTAWFLIALASAVAVAGSGAEVAETIGLAIVFCLVMGFGVRPLLARVSTAYDEAGRVPGGWVALIFAGVLLSAYTTEEIGIALIFGAFVMGLIMPRHAELTEDVTRRIEDFVVTLLLPLFFAYTGLRTNVGLLDRPELWLLTLVLLARRRYRQALRRGHRRPPHRLRLALVGGHRDADEHPRPHRADRPEPGAGAGRHLRGAVRDARPDGDHHHLHGRPGAQPAGSEQRARRAGRGGARGGAPGVGRGVPRPPAAGGVDPRGPDVRRRVPAAAGPGGAARALGAAARAHPREARAPAAGRGGARRPPDREPAARGGLRPDERHAPRADRPRHRGAGGRVRVPEPGRRPRPSGARATRSRWS